MQSRTASGWLLSNFILGRNERGEESDTGRYKVGDGLSPWSALNYSGEGAGGGGKTPMMFSVDGTVDIDPNLTMVKVGLIETSVAPIVNGRFTVTSGGLVTTEAGAGLYRIDAYVSARLAGDAVVTPGLAEQRMTISINDENKAPAWDYYPKCQFSAALPSDGASQTLSIIQDLAAGDVVELRARLILHDGTDIGTMLYSVSDANLIVTPT